MRVYTLAARLIFGSIKRKVNPIVDGVAKSGRWPNCGRGTSGRTKQQNDAIPADVAKKCHRAFTIHHTFRTRRIFSSASWIFLHHSHREVPARRDSASPTLCRVPFPVSWRRRQLPLGGRAGVASANEAAAIGPRLRSAQPPLRQAARF